MKVLVATDVSIVIFKDRYYFSSQVFTIVKRYFDVFGKFSVCCRAKCVDNISEYLIDVTDYLENVIVINSLGKLLCGSYDKILKSLIESCELVICRCPGIAAHRTADIARRLGRQCYSEVMGCAWDAYWNHGLSGKLLAPYMFLKMKQTVYNSSYALYVTKEFLQKRYPCKNKSIGVSNVIIKSVSNEVIACRTDKISSMDTKNLNVVTTAAVNVKYKGQQFVIKAIPKLNKLGIKLRYVLIGGGDNSYLSKLAKKLGVEEQVVFVGRKSPDEVFELLDNADVYIQPSLQEGLPRSVVEALSRGCICIGSKTAGIPELIESKYLVDRKNVKDIVDVFLKISKTSKEQLVKDAMHNFDKASEFKPEVLDSVRNQYYAKILSDLDG